MICAKCGAELTNLVCSVCGRNNNLHEIKYLGLPGDEVLCIDELTPSTIGEIIKDALSHIDVGPRNRY